MTRSASSSRPTTNADWRYHCASARQGPDQAAAGEDHRHRDEPEGDRRRHRSRARRDQRVDQEQEPGPAGGELRYVTDLVGDRAIETLLVDVVHAAHSRQQRPGNNGDRDDHQRLLRQHLVPERLGRAQQPERAHHRDRVADRQHASHGDTRDDFCGESPTRGAGARRGRRARASATSRRARRCESAREPETGRADAPLPPSSCRCRTAPGRCGSSRSFSLTVSS